MVLEIDCRNYFNAKCEKIPPGLKRSLEACEINAKAHNCEKIAGEHPEIKDLLMSCKPQDFCHQQIMSDVGEALSCWKGNINSVMDTLKALNAPIEAAWQKLKSTPLKDYHLPSLPSLPDLRNVHFDPEKTKRKLVDLWHVAETKSAEKYHHYNCYTPEAKEELQCYFFATLVDPTVIAGKSVALLKARRLLKALDQESDMAQDIGNAGIAATKALSKEQFTAKYLHYSPTDKNQNLEWMGQAEKSTVSKNIHFFDVENSELKTLNDTVKDKNWVTSLTNYHKEILHTKTKKLLDELKWEYPDLEISAYSDFKASRFAFKGGAPPDLNERLNKILNETNDEFTQYVTKNKFIDPSTHPENWFRGGFGGTADQANLASRFSRQSAENTLHSYSSAEMKSAMTTKLKAVESQRASLQNELGKTSMVEGSDKKVLTSDALDIIRKNGDDIQKSQADLKNRFGLEKLSTSTVQKMHAYAKSVDEFAPGIHIAERQVANLDEAVFGGFSADMAGMGAKNLSGTASALSNAKDLDEALVQTRKAEKIVTEQFAKQKQVFQDVVKEVLGPERIKTVCSGDDCIAIPKQILKDGEKKKILQRLSDAGYSSQFRLSFIPDNVTEVAARNQLSVHGESIEKILRKKLADKMEPMKLKGVIFGVDMKTTELNKGSIQLITANSSEVKLTPSEQRLIMNNFEKAVEQINEDLAQQGKASTYFALKPELNHNNMKP
ncbi:MAG TPA: hypothetical protein VIG33_16780 [Pseudobdellovibrionaceae bacterium]